MKMRSRSAYDPYACADEGRLTLEHEARYRVWPGHRSEPQIVASLPRQHAEQIVSPFDVLSHREEGADMENILACCAGSDVNTESVQASVRQLAQSGRVHSETSAGAPLTLDRVAM